MEKAAYFGRVLASLSLVTVRRWQLMTTIIGTKKGAEAGRYRMSFLFKIRVRGARGLNFVVVLVLWSSLRTAGN